MGSQAHTVVPPLYFGQLSYTPPPGYSGHHPGKDNVIPGYNYSQSLRSAREDATFANASNPASWHRLCSLERSLQAKRLDPVFVGSDLYKPISSNEGLMPGFSGFVPHIRSNGFPGHSYRKLTRDMGALARTDCSGIAYITEAREAYQEAARLDLENQRTARGDGPEQEQESDDGGAGDYSTPVQLGVKEMQRAKVVWAEFLSKMDEHFSVASVAFRKLDHDHKGYIIPSDLRRVAKMLGISANEQELRVLMQALGCDGRGRVTVLDYMRASQLGLADALKAGACSPLLRDAMQTNQRTTKRLRPVNSLPSLPSSSEFTVSCKASFFNGEASNSASSTPKRKIPMLIFTPRTDPLVDRMLEKQRNKTEGGRHRKKETLDAGGITSTQVLEGGKRFGYKPVKGYSGHQPTWRTEQWEHIQEQLTLRVRPTMRAPVPRMRSLEDELHDQSSAELREAKAAWSLIMENFEEFRKVQTAFRLVDKDYSGVISREELRVLIENALYIQTSDAAFDIIFNTIDKDGSGDISFDEFAAAISDPNIELTDAVATDENALTAIERRNALQQGLSEQAEYNVCATDALALFSKNEAIRISGSSFVIQNLRKKVDEHFYEIKTAFQNCDPELLGSMPSDEFVRVLRAKKLVPEGGEPKLLALVDSLRHDEGGSVPNSVDYMSFLASFGAMGSDVEIVSAAQAHKARVDRDFSKKDIHFVDESCASSRSPSQRAAASHAQALERQAAERRARKEADAQVLKQLTSRSVEQATSNPEVAYLWQDPIHPGKPSKETLLEFQRKYHSRVTSHLPRASKEGDDGSHGVGTAHSTQGLAFPLKKLYRMDHSGSTVGIWDTQAEGVNAGANGFMYGIPVKKSGDKKHQPPSPQQDGAEELGPDESLTEEAEGVWKMLRLAGESAHGSMQRAFRAIDLDGSGKIELGELRHLIQVQLSVDLEEEVLAFIFGCLDQGNKGAITYREFVEALHGPLVRRKGASALEMQAHPLNKAFGQQLALQTPPVMHARAFKKSIERAVQAGDANLSTGAASYQLGDRSAWKAMNMYQTCSRVQQQAVEQAQRAHHDSRFDEAGNVPPAGHSNDAGKERNGSLLAHDTNSISPGTISRTNSAPTIAAYARQAGISYVDTEDSSPLE